MVIVSTFMLIQQSYIYDYGKHNIPVLYDLLPNKIHPNLANIYKKLKITYISICYLYEPLLHVDETFPCGISWGFQVDEESDQLLLLFHS